MVLCLKGEGFGAMLLKASESQSESLWVAEIGVYRTDVSGAKAIEIRNFRILHSEGQGAIQGECVSYKIWQAWGQRTPVF